MPDKNKGILSQRQRRQCTSQPVPIPVPEESFNNPVSNRQWIALPLSSDRTPVSPLNLSGCPLSAHELLRLVSSAALAAPELDHRQGLQLGLQFLKESQRPARMRSAYTIGAPSVFVNKNGLGRYPEFRDQGVGGSNPLPRPILSIG